MKKGVKSDRFFVLSLIEYIYFRYEKDLIKDLTNQCMLYGITQLVGGKY